MKKLWSLLLAICLIASLAACGNAEKSSASTAADDSTISEPPFAITSESTNTPKLTEPITLNIGVPCAPPALPLLRMVDSGAMGENVTIHIDRWDEPETLIAMIQDGKHDLFAYPLTVVAKLYNKGMDVRLMNVNTWGVTYFMTSDPDLTDWSELKGKTVYVPLQSSPPDALTQFFLTDAGLTPGEDVEIIYTTPAEVASLLISGEAQYATLIEPMCTKAMMKNPDVHVAFSFEQEWQRVNDTDSMIPNAGFGTTQEFIDNHPEVILKFNEEYAKALEWVNANPAEAGALMETQFGIKGALVAKAIPNMGLHFETAIDADSDLDILYQLLEGFNPKMIGGALPDEGMYYAG